MHQRLRWRQSQKPISFQGMLGSNTTMNLMMSLEGAREIEIESEPPLPRTGNRQALSQDTDGSSQYATNKHQQLQ